MTLPYSPRVLVVEARERYRAWLVRCLQHAGFECVATSSCDEASQIAREEFFDAMLCDFVLPDGNGARLLRELGVHRPARAVLITHMLSRSIARRSRAMGYDACLDFDHTQVEGLTAALGGQLHAV